MENAFERWITSRRISAALVVIGAVATLVGWLPLRGQMSGLYNVPFGAALLVVATTVVLLSVIVWAVRSLDRSAATSAADEAPLRDGELQHRLLVEGVQDYAIFLLDPAGNVSSWNEGARRIIGYAPAEILGRNFSCIYPAEDLVRGKPAWELAEAARQGCVRDEGWRVRSDGTRFWAGTLITAILGEDGRLAGFSKITRDMTAQKEYQLKLAEMNDELERRVEIRTRELAEANRDLAEKNRENETFVYSVSHDLRSPLVNLQGFSSELERSCAELADLLNAEAVPETVRGRAATILDAGVEEPIHFIRTAVMRLSAIIDALLRLSRAGRVEYRVRHVDLNGVVRRVVDSMRATLAQRGAELVLRPLPSVRGDATALEQVFANLIGNALNYLDPARPGTIEVGVLEHPAGGGDNTARTCFVRDNGQGISAAYQAKVFQAFQRLHPSSAPGEGMGLTIVRRVIERHGGRIWLESTAGQGSTFYVSLPVAEPDNLVPISPTISQGLVGERADRRRDAARKEEVCDAH
jgi:PAS domain S-box-containing protein